MRLEVVDVSSKEALAFITQVEARSVENVGYYLRLPDRLVLTQMNFAFSDEKVLSDTDTSLEAFRKLFRLGFADARVFIYTDAEKYNSRLRMHSFQFGTQIAPSMLFDKSRVKLCGKTSDLWEEDNPIALQNSVFLFSKMFPQFNVISGPTAWDWMDKDLE